MPGETGSPSPEDMGLTPEDLSTESPKPGPPQKKDSTDKLGAQFLHQKDSKLHTSPPVENTQKRLQARGEDYSQKPAGKIDAYLERFKDVLKPKPLNGGGDFNRGERNVEFLKRRLYENVVIKPEDIPQGYYDNQSRLLRERGQDDTITEEMKAQLSEVIVSDQKSTLDNWTNYLASPDSDSFPPWAKYWAYTGMQKLSTFDKEAHAFGKRGKGTVAPLPDLNREALAYAVDNVFKSVTKQNIPEAEDNPDFQRLLQAANFGKLYAHAIEKVTPTGENELTNTQGEWVKYPQGSDHMPLVKSLQGHGTEWCTAGETTAESQLSRGDFYVYYSLDQQGTLSIPRLAIRMEGSEIGEVRGIASEQNVDPYIANTSILKDKLKEFPDGERYIKAETDMKMVTALEQKVRLNEQLSKDDLRFLYEIDSYIQGFGHYEDPRIARIRGPRDKRNDIAEIMGYSPDQISLTEEEALRGGVLYHFGAIELREDMQRETLELPKTVRGDITVWGEINSSTILPEIVEGGFIAYDMKKAIGLRLPKKIGGSVTMTELESAEDVEFPETVGRILIHNLISAKNVRFPKNVVGDVFLDRLRQVENVEFPETVGGLFRLDSLVSSEALTLPKEVGKDCELTKLESAKGITLPEKVGGKLDLSSLKSTEGLVLPREVGVGVELTDLNEQDRESLQAENPGLRIGERIFGG